MPTTCTVLVVDDDTDNREMLAEYLTLSGITVATAATGSDALRQAEALLPDVVLMDIGLPDLDGFAVTRELKARERTRDIIVVAATGFAREQDLAEAVAAGCHSVIVKPFEPEVVSRLVTAVAADPTCRLGLSPRAERSAQPLSC